MFDLIALEGRTLRPLAEGTDLKLDQALKFFAKGLEYTAKTGKEVEIGIRKHD